MPKARSASSGTDVHGGREGLHAIDDHRLAAGVVQSGTEKHPRQAGKQQNRVAIAAGIGDFNGLARAELRVCRLGHLGRAVAALQAAVGKHRLPGALALYGETRRRRIVGHLERLVPDRQRLGPAAMTRGRGKCRFPRIGEPGQRREGDGEVEMTPDDAEHC